MRELFQEKGDRKGPGVGKGRRGGVALRNSIFAGGKRKQRETSELVSPGRSEQREKTRLKKVKKKQKERVNWETRKEGKLLTEGKTRNKERNPGSCKVSASLLD